MGKKHKTIMKEALNGKPYNLRPTKALRQKIDMAKGLGVDVAANIRLWLDEWLDEEIKARTGCEHVLIPGEQNKRF